MRIDYAKAAPYACFSNISVYHAVADVARVLYFWHLLQDLIALINNY